MSFPMVETGYKPEFALGALYAGENAANTQQMQQEEIIKAFLANQREQQMQPLDVQVKQWDAASAQDKLNDPNYREWLRKGYIGQMQSQDAAGRKAQRTWESDSDVTNAENRNKKYTEDLLSKLNELKSRGTSGTFNFNTQPKTNTSSKVTDPNFPSVSPGMQLQRDLESLRLKMGELDSNPNDVMLQKDIENARASIEKALISGVTPETETSPQRANPLLAFATPPQRNGGVTPGNSEYEQIMGALVDTPKFRQDLAKVDQKLDSAEYIAQMKVAQALKVQEMKNQLKQDPKTAEAVVASLLTKMRSGEQLTQTELEVYAYATSIIERKAPETKPGTTLDTTNPKLKNVPLKENEARTPILRPGGGATGRGAGSSSGTTKSGNKFTVEKQEK